MSTFGFRLKEERERLGLNQTEMANRCRTTRKSQFNYETDARKPDAAYMADMAEIGADVLYILTGQHNPAVITLKPDEATLLDNYRKANHSNQQLLLATSAALTGQPASGSGVSVIGNGNRTAGLIYQENPKRD